MEYFEGLFATGGWMIDHRCLDALEGWLTNVMNASLMSPFTEEEVKAVLFQMSPLKAPEPDSFNADFFQKNWDFVGLEVCKAILHSLNHAVIDCELNYMFLALISKTKNP